MKLRELKRAVRSMTPRELITLDAWLRELINAAESKRRDRVAAKREAMRRRQATHKTYRLESVRCGKENCKCAGGELHGHYWYAYWSEGGKTRSAYIGKKLPNSQRNPAYADYNLT
jgi:hypothetical protein